MKNKKRRSIIISIAVLAVVLAGVGVYFAAFANRDTMDQEFAHTAREGDLVFFTVSAADLVDMYGYEARVIYDDEYLLFEGNPKSEIHDISMIFYNEFDTYLLIGATMIGDRSGYSSEQSNVFTLMFRALKDFDTQGLTIGNISIVKSDLEYMQDIEGWKTSIEIRPQ